MWYWILAGWLMAAPSAEGPATPSSRSPHPEVTHCWYPSLLDSPPDTPSPCRTDEGREIVTVRLKNGKYALMPVTVENGRPLHYSQRVPFAHGKDQQLHVDRDDFPSLAATGLHVEADLEGKDRITGLPVEVITYIGRPGRFSGAGFLAHDEDILSVLRGDNRLVRTLGLTHPETARPLYHVWNMILQEIEEAFRDRLYEALTSHFVAEQPHLPARAHLRKGTGE